MENVNGYSKDENNLVAISYISSIFLLFIVPLILWIINKNEKPELAERLKEPLNFGITYALLFTISSVLTSILIGFLLYPIILILLIVFSIKGAMRASNGNDYKVPAIYRFIS